MDSSSVENNINTAKTRSKFSVMSQTVEFGEVDEVFNESYSVKF